MRYHKQVVTRVDVLLFELLLDSLPRLLCVDRPMRFKTTFAIDRLSLLYGAKSETSLG